MKCFIGIDLGSTTTKALILDEKQKILGRGITNSRSNYDIAAAVAKEEALVDTRINLVRQSLQPIASRLKNLEEFLSDWNGPSGWNSSWTNSPTWNRSATRMLRETVLQAGKKPSSLRLCVKSSASFGQKHRCCLHREPSGNRTFPGHCRFPLPCCR